MTVHDQFQAFLLIASDMIFDLTLSPISHSYRDGPDGNIVMFYLQAAAVELVPYLLVSFGHPSRIDYGTGHETSFVVWLCESS